MPFTKGDAIIIHYEHADYPAVVNAGPDEDGEYHVVTGHSASWLSPDGPVITFEACPNTPDHDLIRMTL